MQSRTVKRYDYSFTIWDWNVAWLDEGLFRRVIDQIHSLGFNKVELGVPWHSVEKQPSAYDFVDVDRRLDYLRSLGLDCRFRVNVQDPPSWFRGEVFRWPDGTVFDKEYGVQLEHLAIPSFFDDEGVEAQLRWVEAVARHYAGNSYEYTLGIGLHFELKYGGWNSYEAPAQAAFQSWLTGHYGEIRSLNDAWRSAYADFDSIPAPSPPSSPANGIATEPDLTRSNLDWIHFREEHLSHLVSRYNTAIRRGDSTAVISAPLGECFRKDAAEFGNQDIYGLSRGADHIVFSYDFFIHGPHDLWKMDQMVRTYLDTCGLPVKVELDGVATGTYRRYGDESMFESAAAALNAGATGINIANYTQERRWAEDLGQFPFLARLGAHISDLNSRAVAVLKSRPPDTLFYISKWTQYCFRGDDQWLHLVQFGLERLLREAGCRTRLVTDENLLHEELDGYVLVVIPFAAVVDPAVTAPLNRLLAKTSTLIDLRPGEVTLGLDSSVDKARIPFDGVAEGYGAVRQLEVAAADLEGVPSTYVVQIVPPKARTPTVQRFRSSGHKAIGRNGDVSAIWLIESPARLAVLGFSPSAGFEDQQARWNTMRLIQDVVGWLTGRPTSTDPDWI